ncbi:putative cytochrome P450 oxidoreductase [Mytilinidion resinicola]|uniref:Cytochrome P450 oxidoreductase n=1 Tax=Mytilinidion resinicola TaxID=574789 RepID=A0A6A6YEZ6_9PEZI|nr:putative cytochrome P450 oxidoreductase [Mytilinidion resinicola]KAF2807406.1 putative cytochrome P450 oxidoreductase [Mytilinidion resinicola]
MSISLPTAAVLCLGVAVLIYRLSQMGKRLPNMPPGPPTLPFLGNALQIPREGFYKKMKEWAETYGKIYSLTVGPTNIIVLCDRKAVRDLIDKKSAIYSDRPADYVGRLLTGGDHTLIDDYNAEWREKRKQMAQVLSPRRCDEQHSPIQEAEAKCLLLGFLDDPEHCIEHIKRTTASIAGIITYGQRAPTIDHPYATQVFDIMQEWTEAMGPGANPPVDVYPIFKLWPTRFAPWKQRAYRVNKKMDVAWAGTLNAVRKRRAVGDKRECMADSLLVEVEKNPNYILSEHSIQNLLGEMIEGGADTTTAQLSTFLVAMACYPRVQAKAQALIDEKIGSGRSPTWKDFDSLSYINAMVKEGLRWRPVTSVGFPHKVREDDTYEGMLIPKGSTVFVPVWALNHDSAQFKDAEEYWPERYDGFSRLADSYSGSGDYEGRDHYTYGAGRRICPGIHLAERNQWRSIAKILWAFKISKARDPVTGEEIDIDVNAYKSGLAQSPLPFKVHIEPRSVAHAATIRREWAEAKEILAKYE